MDTDNTWLTASDFAGSGLAEGLGIPSSLALDGPEPLDAIIGEQNSAIYPPNFDTSRIC